MPRALQWEKVPKGARSSVCRGEGCGRQIYWIERARKGKPGTARVQKRARARAHPDAGGSTEVFQATETAIKLLTDARKA